MASAGALLHFYLNRLIASWWRLHVKLTQGLNQARTHIRRLRTSSPSTSIHICIYIYIHIDVFIYVCMYICITCFYLFLHLFTCTYIYTYKHNTHVCKCRYVRMYLGACTNIHIHILVTIYIYICIHTPQKPKTLRSPALRPAEVRTSTVRATGGTSAIRLRPSAWRTG